MQMPEQLSQQHSVALGNIRRRVFGEGGDAILKKIDQSDEPAKVVGEVAFELVTGQANASIGARKPIDERILQQLAEDTINDVTQLAVSAGVWDFGSDQEAQQFQSEALNVAMDEYAKMQIETGELDLEEIDRTFQDIAAGKYDKGGVAPDGPPQPVGARMPQQPAPQQGQPPQQPIPQQPQQAPQGQPIAQQAPQQAGRQGLIPGGVI